MQSENNCHRHIWMLAGTGEGPVLADALIKDGWKVSVSVVSYQASLQYSDIPVEKMFIGSLQGVEDIRKVLIEAIGFHNGFDWVVDATHPFAVVISSDLAFACKDLNQPLLRYERYLSCPEGAVLINHLRELPKSKIQGKKVLLAIGSRKLSEAVSSLRNLGADVYARVLPTPQSIRKALACSIPDNHLAILHPSQINRVGEIEKALCKSWNIETIVCRQSGGLTQQLWEEISLYLKLRLYLMIRPTVPDGVETVQNLEELLNRVN